MKTRNSWRCATSSTPPISARRLAEICQSPAAADVRRHGDTASRSQNVEQLKKQLEDAFLKDPGGTLLSMAAYMQTENQKVVAAEIAKATGGMKSDLTGGNVDAFRAKMQADPILAPAVEEFDKLIKEIGPEPDARQHEQTARRAGQYGAGQHLPQPSARVARQTQPPPWGGGMTSTPDSGQRPARPGSRKLTAEMNEYVKHDG